jgi:hypothetical protein
MSAQRIFMCVASTCAWALWLYSACSWLCSAPLARLLTSLPLAGVHQLTHFVHQPRWGRLLLVAWLVTVAAELLARGRAS